MSTTDPPPDRRDRGATAIRTEGPTAPPFAPLVGRRPSLGAGKAAKNVITDVRSLVQAEIALAKAELATGVKAKVKGAGLFVAVAVVGWLALQVFLVFLGFLFALFLPDWAAVGLVLLLLVVVMGVLGFLGYRKLKAEANLGTTMQTVEESKDAAQAAITRAQDSVRTGTEEAKATARLAGQDASDRVRRRFARPSTAAESRPS